MRSLEAKISQQEEMISSKEAQLDNLQSSMTVQQRENKKLAALDEDRLKLSDELDAIKRDLERQSRKANTADNYMRKLQASQAVEKERDSLRQELESVQNKAAASEKIRQENIALRKSNEETSRTLSQIEQEYEELRLNNRQLRMTRDSAVQQLDALTERFAQDQETIAELRDRHGEIMKPSSPGEYRGLKGELVDSFKHEEDMYTSRVLIRWLRILTLHRETRFAVLQKQNHQLSSESADKNGQIATLRTQLEHTEAVSIDRYTHIQKIQQENIALQTILSKVQQGHPIEGSVNFKDLLQLHSAHRYQSTEVYKRMREQLKAAESDKARITDDLAILHAERESLQSDCESSSQNQSILCDLSIDLLQGSLVNMDKSSMFDALKKQDGPTNPDLADIIKATSPSRDFKTRGDAYVNIIDNSRERNAKHEKVRYLPNHEDVKKLPERHSFTKIFTKKRRANH